MTLASGTRLGPYEVLERLGAGGMGEVYRARDPRLSREVAVKLISTDGATSPDRLRRFETEARAAAQLSHPNVVTVFDVGTHEGQPYLVLELLEGETLRETLHGGVPPLRQAVSWALEISRGLAAAHDRGIVHRDLKPENVFLTTDGRVKIVDFGLAKLHEPLVSDEADRESPTATKDTSPGVLLGTVGYMAPEQVKGQTPAPRTDVFALGAVLYEMVSGRRAFSGESAPEVLAAILRDEPPALESLQHGVPAAVETVARRCLAKRPADRFSSARAVEAALETVLSTLEPGRISVGRAVETRGPYPGLSSFTEADAERFFGREGEVEALWEKMRRGRLLAVIGPSGAGKTSFVRAGLVPARPSGWGAIVATPGAAPMRSLARALVGELPSDADTTRQLLGFDDPDVALSMMRRWRESHLEALLVVDQFEELFTLCPPEEQEGFAGLLGRLAREADVHVLLSMRDDFLIRCHQQPALEAVFQNLTPLLALEGDALRRALTEPAKREGFSFEDESLVAEMLESVEGARAALPLLAFAVARLWEKRDGEEKLLTRRAYEEIGGVAGALAQHAEQTLERIGLQREPLVREIFRNLVTAQWTRAVADREQLLSALPDPEAGGQVLDSLVDARLLTSYEVRDSTASSRGAPSGAPSLPSSRGAPSGTGDEGSAAPSEPTQRQRIEIVHESLLRAWPRLVRWQAQDEEGAVLRDQLKQAANLWVEKGRPDDLLWTGTSEREFELWHGRYPGKLTALEEDYSRAMVDRRRRRRRLRQMALAGVVSAALAIAGVVSVLWQRAVAGARRAEAARVVALGRLQLDSYPTATLAYAQKSLEIADTEEARELAVEALWRAPTARILPVEDTTWNATFSPDGSQLAALTFSENILLVSKTGETRRLPGFTLPNSPGYVAFTPSGDLLLTRADGDEGVRVVSLPDGRTVRWLRPEPPDRRSTPASSYLWPRSDGLLFLVGDPDAGPFQLKRQPYAGGPQTTVSAFHGPMSGLDVGRTRMAIARDGRVSVRPLAGGLDVSEQEWASLAGSAVRDVILSPEETRLAIVDGPGQLLLKSLPGQAPAVDETLAMEAPDPQSRPSFDPTGSLVAWGSSGRRVVSLWDLTGPPDAEPRMLPRSDTALSKSVGFQPEGRWVAVANALTLTFWAIQQPWARVLNGHSSAVRRLAFTPGSESLVSCGTMDGVSVWPLEPSAGPGRRRLASARGNHEEPCYELALTPEGDQALWGAIGASLSPLDGSPGRWLVPPPDGDVIPEVFHGGAFDRSGRWAATVDNFSRPPGVKTLRIWDLASGDVREWPQVPEGEKGDGFAGGAYEAKVLPDGSVLTAGHRGIRRYDPDTGTGQWVWELAEGEHARVAVSADGSRLVGLRSRDRHPVVGPAVRLGPGGDTEHFLANHGNHVSAITVDASGEVLVTGDNQGTVRVGRLAGGEPHLLPGHSGLVEAVAISPDQRWIASAAGSQIRVWPMPDLEKTPFHTLPYDELMVKLRSFTNLEVVEDESSPTGYRTEIGPFPGWDDVPTW